jgi:hypothetical protein
VETELALPYMLSLSLRSAIFAAHEIVELIFGAGAPNGLVDLFNGTYEEEH